LEPQREGQTVENAVDPRSDGLAWWEVAVLATGVVAAAVAIVVTLRADFLAYRGWLAVQKADLILGPILVGVYWHRRRSGSRFGPVLIALGLVAVPYILQSSSSSIPFTIGVHWEGVLYLATLATILAFPTGRLPGLASKLILSAGALLVVVPFSARTLFSPEISAVGSISSCRSACPTNAAHVSASSSVMSWLVHFNRIAIIAVALATAALLVWRLATGTAPYRRALAVGTPIALVFLLTQALFQLTLELGHKDLELYTYARWASVAARAALWWGFLLALIVAELFAARVLRTIVGESLRRPSLRELTELLRRPLGDPRLQLAFHRAGEEAWVDGEGRGVGVPAPDSGRALTVVGRGGRSDVAIVHDVQLADDPELLQAAGSAALLAFENAELQNAWNASISELQRSQARLAAATARERQKLERDLHDGAQQALMAVGVRLGLAREAAPTDARLEQELNEIAADLRRALDELRDLAHGIYPSVLANLGLVHALESVASSSGGKVEVTGEGVGRYPAEVESAIYYSCREALQNAIRHGGPPVSIRLSDDGDALIFAVRDGGDGFDVGNPGAGAGLANVKDRIGALEGFVTIASAPGKGTLVTGRVPLRS
jgi:signal transduction histidine kinase